jgi:2-haloacid dehalogenase
LTSRTGEAAEVFDAFSSLLAQSDAADALSAACKSGIPVLALTNGSAESTRQSLEKAGLSDFVTRIVSIDDAKAWKPHAKAYHYAAQAAGVLPAQLGLIAVHAWDCHGAKAAGLIAGWVSRNERLFNPALMAPDVSGASLPEVCNAMLSLPD